MRGIVLHKLMEEFLTGELDDAIPIESRTAPGICYYEIEGYRRAAPASDPGSLGDGPNGRATLKFADVAAVRTTSCSRGADLVEFQGRNVDGGRADAVAVQGNV